MSTDDPKKPLSDEELEALFEESSKKKQPDLSNNAQADKIVDRAIRQSSSKNVAEYAFVKFWTGVLEFASLFGIFLKQKSVNKDSQNDDDNKSNRS